MIPDDETLRRIRELRERMPDTATQHLIDEARRQHEDPFRQEMIRRHQEFNDRFGDRIKAIADTVSGNETLKMIRDHGPQIPTSFSSREQYLDTLHAFREATRGLPFDLDSVAQQMQQFQNGPTWAAFETIRQFGYTELFDEFPDIEETIVKEAPTAKPEQVQQAVKKYVTEQKKRGLTPKRLNILNTGLGVFSLAATIYFGVWHSNTVINNTIIIIEPPYEQVTNAKSFCVIEACELKAQPNSKSATMALIPKDVEVRFIYSYEDWLYVEYAAKGPALPKYGFVSKQYLREME